MLKLDVNLDAIIPPRGIAPATIQLHKRQWSAANVEFFQCFAAGTVLTLYFVIDPDAPKAPTQEQFRLLLEFIGQWLGLTQWGAERKFGYGVFKVESLETVDHNNYDPSYA